MIIAVTGTPGKGKTTIGRLLARELEYGFISLNDLARKKGFYCGYDRKRRAKIVDIGLLGKEIGQMAGKNAVIESHYAHEMPCDIIIVLRAKPKELIKRGKKKGWWKGKIAENVQAEIMEVCKSEALERGKPVMEFDTTGRSPGNVVREIIRSLKLKPYSR
ncbi:MAG: adenylate kinase family protein [Candidatus Aenigmarchaeota archaeon]|nr:adenylate kinase family protein [Candidatus Aenigmarchaeota archaeon]